MAKLQLKVNGSVVEKNIATLEFLKAVMTTGDPGAKTVVSAVTGLKDSAAYFSAFEKAYKSGDSLEIIVDERPAAKFSAGNLLRKMKIALDVKNWDGEIFTEKSEKKSADKGLIEA